jgi:hypothetical protein
MRFASKLSPDQWAEARRLRAEGSTYSDIASRLGVTVATIKNRAGKEGWPTPRVEGNPAAPVRKPSPTTVETRQRLAQRLYKITEVSMKKLELSMHKQLQALEQDPDAVVSPAAAREERDALAALIDSINQITEMASEPASAAVGGRKSAPNPELTALSDEIDAAGLAAASEKDQQRTELARQLAKVVGPA